MSSRLQNLEPRTPGRLLGKYRLLARLGAGGMGLVYKAEHVLMKRLVALKVVAAPPDAFRREVEAAARLSHPNIVAAYDAAEADGVSFLVTEYVAGIDLERRVRSDGPLPPRLACRCVAQAADALQYAYECGLLHCDVKPANLLLSGHGDAATVKVLDLGLARLTATVADGGPLVGTPDYLAPEVAHDGARRDVRSDLYSLGCTLYFLLTGEVPFPGGSWTEKLFRHQFEVPTPVRALAPHVSQEIAHVVDRLLAKEPDRRFAEPREVVLALDAAWQKPTPSRRPLPSLRSALIAVGLGVLAAGAARYANHTAVAGAEPSVAAVTPAPSEMPILLERTGTTFATLAEAVAAAANGDTVRVAASAVVEPLAVSGKALTLRAAPGTRPELRAAPTKAWQTLLSSDRDLTIEGIDLRNDDEDGGPAHLVSVAGASLRLIDCRLTAARPAAVVARRAPQVVLTGCRVVGPGPVLCLETGPTPGVCEVEGGALEVRGDDAAIAAWRPDGAASTPWKIHLVGVEVRARRAVTRRE